MFITVLIHDALGKLVMHQQVTNTLGYSTGKRKRLASERKHTPEIKEKWML